MHNNHTSENSNPLTPAVRMTLLLILICAVAVILCAISANASSCTLPDSTKYELIDTSDYYDVSTKNNLDLVKWAEAAYENDWGYVYGTWGNVLTSDLLEQKVAQYPVDAGEHERFIRKHYLGGRVTDCIGLIKGYCWYSSEEGFVYCGNNTPDVGANVLYEYASEKGDISTLPETPGVAVYAPGHIGVYIGNGWVIEAKSTLDGVCKTRVEDRPWTGWCRIDYIEYVE